MQANKLRQRVTVLSLAESDSDTGANSDYTLTDGVTIWANIEPLSVKDVLMAQASGSQARLRCVIRYRNDITSQNQIRYRGKVYKIDGDPLPDKDSGREYLTLILVSI